MNQHYNDLLYVDKRFVIKNGSLIIENDSLNTDVCEEVKIDNGVFNQIVSHDYICDMGDSSFSIKDKLLELEKDHNLLREEYRDFKFEDIGKLVNKIDSLTTAVEEMRGESDKRTMSGIVRDPYGRIQEEGGDPNLRF